FRTILVHDAACRESILVTQRGWMGSRPSHTSFQASRRTGACPGTLYATRSSSRIMVQVYHAQAAHSNTRGLPCVTARFLA
ncbi:hypothetical protein TPAR_03442, partial [Tolypocladium paradoxum]